MTKLHLEIIATVAVCLALSAVITAMGRHSLAPQVKIVRAAPPSPPPVQPAEMPLPSPPVQPVIQPVIKPVQVAVVTRPPPPQGAAPPPPLLQRAEVETNPLSRAEPRHRNVCEAYGLTRVETRGGRSWHCERRRR